MVSWVAQERTEWVSLRGSSFEVQLFASDVGVNCCSLFVEFFEHLYVVRHRVAAKLFTRGLWAKNGVNRKKWFQLGPSTGPALGVRTHTHFDIPRSSTSTCNAASGLMQVHRGLHVLLFLFMRSTADSLREGVRRHTLTCSLQLILPTTQLAEMRSSWKRALASQEAITVLPTRSLE